VFIAQDLIEVVCYERYVIDVAGEKIPFTISLLGCKDYYIGIKATAYFKSILKEEGVFFKIHSTEEWALDSFQSQEFNQMGKAKKADYLRYGLCLPKLLLEEDGFKKIFELVKFDTQKNIYILGNDGKR
jgi:hypothetical protein